MPDPTDSHIAGRLLELALAQVASHALILLDADGIVVGWHAGAQRLFGYAPDEIIGRSVDILFTPEDLHRDISQWERRTAAEAGASEDDRWQVRRDGGRIWVNGALTALRDSRSGQLLGFAKIVRNRTEQRSQRDQLENRAASIRNAYQRKDTFIATLAHELRNPLSAASAALQILAEQQKLPPAAAAAAMASDGAFAVGTIRRQLEFMARMVDDLLQVARAAAGKIQLQKQRIVLRDVLARALETCRPAINERSHELHLLLPDVPIQLDADPDRLTQVFVNLIGNAAKYTQYGGTIWIKVTTEGDEAVIRVRDNGVGISPDVMPHIFDLFTQAELTQPDGQGGLGIGLSLVHDTVGLHGGSVQATSDGLGKGSQFTVRLPLPKGPVDAEAPSTG